MRHFSIQLPLILLGNLNKYWHSYVINNRVTDNLFLVHDSTRMCVSASTLYKRGRKSVLIIFIIKKKHSESTILHHMNVKSVKVLLDFARRRIKYSSIIISEAFAAFVTHWVLFKYSRYTEQKKLPMLLKLLLSNL